MWHCVLGRGVFVGFRGIRGVWGYLGGVVGAKYLYRDEPPVPAFDRPTNERMQKVLTILGLSLSGDSRAEGATASVPGWQARRLET